MKIINSRPWKKPNYTIGKITINGTYFSNSLEDTDRGLRQSMPPGQINQIKVYGKTAIPTGEYKVVLSVSPRFSSKPWAKKYKGLVPEILNVKGFSGVRIHPGNGPESTDGCILVGDNAVVGKLVNSQKRYYELMDNFLVPAWERGEEITLIIE